MIRSAILVVASLALAKAAAAQDNLKIAIGQINNWENQAPTLDRTLASSKKQSISEYQTKGSAADR